MIICLSGLVNLSQPLIDAANHDVFHDNPIPINVVLASLGFIFGTALVLFVWYQDRRCHLRQGTMREVTERSRLLPEVDEEEGY